MNCLSETINSGSVANVNGNNLEKFVYNALLGCGYDVFWDHKKQVFPNRSICSGKQFCYQVPVGTTIYNSNRIADFLIIDRKIFSEDLIIECKWQQSAGSVDEKYPFLVWNIIKTKVPTLIILDGDGYKPAAKDWLEKQSKNSRDLIGVYSMKDFQKIINKGFFVKKTPYYDLG